MVKRKCPITGKMIDMQPRPPRVDVIDPKPLPAEVTTTEKERVAGELSDIRKEWVNIGPHKRSGKTGDALMKRYRRLSLEHWHLTGNHPPPIYDEM